MEHTDRCRQWLLENGYEDMAESIEKVMGAWRRRGKKTRRDWWDTLAGGIDGRPFTVNGIEFLVLRAAQVRQGKTITKNAVSRNPKEVPPPKRKTGRWHIEMRNPEHS